MNTELLRRVRRLRKDNPFMPLGMQYAVEQARRETKAWDGKYPFLSEISNGYGEEKATGEVDGFTVTVKIEPDNDCQLGEDDVTGTFGDSEQDGAIKNTLSGWGNGDGLKYYYPSNYRMDPENFEHEGRGMSRGVRADYQRWLIEQDMSDDYHRQYYGVIAEVEYDGVEVGQSSLWGIDMLDRMDAVPYFREVAEEQIDEALDQAKEWLAKHTPSKPTTARFVTLPNGAVEATISFTFVAGSHFLAGEIRDALHERLVELAGTRNVAATDD